jgi:hypothetical protein
MAESGVPAATGLTLLRGGMVVLALATAIIHIVLAVPLSLIGFYLNGVGYMVLAATLCLPQAGRYRRPVRWVFMGYTSLTIVLWIVLGWPYTTIGYIDKAIEIALLGLLWVDHRRSSHDPRADAIRAV